ncbi:tRNA 5-methoxyuridine(34)/uridine 5-oxyacetic acid(34) synthase CmoB [Halioxenophilus aromaticivorans]|uniref:tRNA 5-methoxyuridine(34)/uridine 5-oxyacetic acid(34) synthase CmoB n=1 Tax=Halioxenophilus aromaticivorans TaxID=1306992 RepID=UPI003860177E
MEYYQDLIENLKGTNLAAWAERIPAQISDGLSTKRFGDLPAWISALEQLPAPVTKTIELKDRVEIGAPGDASVATLKSMEDALRALIPWRKGPYTVHGIHIDTEWRSDWKWHRLIDHIAPLHDRTVLDVGCGNGYHCWRALGAGAKRVIGIDPSPRFIVQFAMMKKLIGAAPVHVLPVTMEQVPANLQAFDTTFSMGVLYHRRSPFDHLKELKETLTLGGELVLETLVVDGPEGHVLVPKKRYAMMNNVWFLPSCATLHIWLEKIGFKKVKLIDVNETTLEEQRSTQWMKFHSLEQFLDPNDRGKTIEGYPRPKRAVFTAEA